MTSWSPPWRPVQPAVLALTILGVSAPAQAQTAGSPQPLTLAQAIPLTGALMVTTPQAVSVFDVRKGIGMFRDLKVPVLGIVENMSYYVCPHGDRLALFGEGGGARLAQECGLPLLGQIPLHPDVRQGADEGEPVLLRRPGSVEAGAFRDLARAVVARAGDLAGPSLPAIS